MYKTRATRRDDGNYDLSYGKGSKKLTSLLSQVNGQWFTGGSYELRAETKREAIAEWSKWAVTSYGSDDSSAEPAPKQKPTVLLDVAGAEFTDPLPQLRALFELPGPAALTQSCIDGAPTRADQIRRWYAAFVYTGKEFALPQTTRADVQPTEEVSDAEAEDGTEPDAEATTGAAEAAAGNRHPPQYRPPPRVP